MWVGGIVELISIYILKNVLIVFAIVVVKRYLDEVNEVSLKHQVVFY